MKSTKLDKQLLFIMIALTIFGMIMILSASSMASYMRYNKSINYYLIRQGFMWINSLFNNFVFSYKSIQKNIIYSNNTYNYIIIFTINNRGQI